MSMSRIHYIMIANAIKRSKTKYSSNKLNQDILVKCLCIGFERDNNLFNSDKFIDACNFK